MQGKSWINGLYKLFRKYSYFSQCDERWADTSLGFSSVHTICTSGCLMSSVSMILNTFGTNIGDDTAYPLSVNNWLVKHHGFAGADAFVWDSVSVFGLHFNDFHTLDEATGIFVYIFIL